MNLPFPHANLVVGFLVLLVGFIFHWLGQLICLLNWDLAARIGLAEKDIPPEYKDYELGMAAADVIIGWTYGLAGVGLLWGVAWGFRLAWIPGVVFTYHGLSFWFWSRNQSAPDIVCGPSHSAWAGFWPIWSRVFSPCWWPGGLGRSYPSGRTLSSTRAFETDKFV